MENWVGWAGMGWALGRWKEGEVGSWALTGAVTILFRQPWKTAERGGRGAEVAGRVLLTGAGRIAAYAASSEDEVRLSPPASEPSFAAMGLVVRQHCQHFPLVALHAPALVASEVALDGRHIGRRRASCELASLLLRSP